MTTDNREIKLVSKAPDWDEGLRQWLENYIQENPHHDTKVLQSSDWIGFSRTGLDAYLNCTYFLPKEAGGQGVQPGNSKLEERIRQFRERIEGTVRHGWANKFVETRTWVQLQHACDTAIEEKVIVVVYGKPGVGKTRSLAEYAAKKTKSVMPVNLVFSVNVTVRYFVQKWARAVGLDDRPPTARLEDTIVEKLKRNPRPVFIDQANYLNEKSLGSICYIWDLARIPVVLVGTKDLYDLFTTSRLTQDVRAQLSSRVAMHYPLVELATEQMVSILKRALGADGTDENIAKVITLTGGNHRHIDFIVPRINKLKGMPHIKSKLEKGEITVGDVIDTAGRRLMTA